MIGYKKGCLLLYSITLAVCTAQIEALNLYHLENLPNNFEYDESENPLETLKLQSANDPNYLIEVLSQLRSRVPHAMEISKRGIDFGLGRGFSGSQAAKHFLGMAAARYSGGPGRKKKRSSN